MAWWYWSSLAVSSDATTGVTEAESKARFVDFINKVKNSQRKDARDLFQLQTRVSITRNNSVDFSPLILVMSFTDFSCENAMILIIGSASILAVNCNKER
jgi:hypothetical protein